MPFTVAIIGAGSIGFTRKVVRDLLSVPGFGEEGGMRITLTDINPTHLDVITRLLKREVKCHGLKTEIVAYKNRRKALTGARYILNFTRIGGLEAFRTDVEIPLKYGVDQCVGDTLCAGGIMYGQRNAPVILDFCKDIREVAEPDALFLNYANPNAMNTWTALTYGGVRTLGLCHGVQHGHQMIASAIEHWINRGRKPGQPSWQSVSTKDVDIICAGINHQTWYIKIHYRGQDWTGRMLEAFENHPDFPKYEKVRIDILRRFGYFSTESNGHLSEYLPWYRKRRKEIKKWICKSEWIHGMTGGYLANCEAHANWVEEDAPTWLEEAPAPLTEDSRSNEHGSYIIESLETGRPYRGHFNVRNSGCISNLPEDAIVEVPCYVDRNGISVPRVGDLPMGCAAICNASISVQRLAVEAAQTGDLQLLRQAMMMDPLTGAVCTPEEIDALVDEMLIAQAEWLPQYKNVIAEAKKRMRKRK